MNMSLPPALEKEGNKYFLTMEWTATHVFVRYQASYHEDDDLLSMWDKQDKMDSLLEKVGKEVKNMVGEGKVVVV
jgi:hypothetical protein